MRAATRILAVDHPAGPMAGLIERLEDLGVACETGLGERGLLACLEDGRADVVLVDTGRLRAIDITRELRRRPATRHVPVVAVAADRTSMVAAHAVAVGADDVLPLPVGDGELVARLNAWVGLAAMELEVARRQAVLARFDEALYGGHGYRLRQHPAGILLVGAACGEQVQVTTALGGRISATYVESAAAAIEQLRRQSFNAVVLTSIRDEALPRRLCAELRADLRLADLPVIAVMPPDSPFDREAPFAWGVTDALFQPIHPEILRLRVQAWIRQQGLRRTLRGCIDGRTPLPVCDYLTGLWGYGFACAYLDDLLHHRALSGGHTAVAVLDVEGMARINAAHGHADGDAVLAAIGQLIGACVRAEDLPARLVGDSFLIVFDAIGESEAAAASERVAATIAATPLPITGGRTARAALAFAVAPAAPGDDATRLIARAARALGRPSLREAS
jgi:two-component system, cell cycle response regulator